MFVSKLFFESLIGSDVIAYLILVCGHEYRGDFLKLWKLCACSEASAWAYLRDLWLLCTDESADYFLNKKVFGP